MSRRIHMTVIVGSRMLVRLKMRSRIKGKNMMFMIKLMRKYLAIERPAKRICQYADK